MREVIRNIMKAYKVLYKETMIHKFVVPAKSKAEAVRHIKDRIYWDLEPLSECSDDDYSVKDIQILDEMPTASQWWNKVLESRQSWLEQQARDKAAKQAAENNNLRTDF
tara:strand:+ start:261 stop:587 length:327 start_codon:yes stop_codon:yes gene_type:complete